MANVNKVGEVYKCEICGNVVEVKEVGGGNWFVVKNQCNYNKKKHKKKLSSK